MTQPATDDEIIESIGPYNYGWHDSDEAGQKARRGLSEEVVRDISAKKKRARMDARTPAQSPQPL